jgi:putative transposase
MERETAKIVKTWSRFIKNDHGFLELAQESGRVYSAALKTFWSVVENEDDWINSAELQKRLKTVIERENLHSDSYLAAMQQVHKNITTWKEAKKKNDDAKPPYKEKSLQPIFFKKSQFKLRDGMLVISLNRHKEYLSVKWNSKIPKPVYGNVTWVRARGWKLNLVIEFDVESVPYLDYDKLLSIDLGVKRTATCFDGEEVFSLNGKPLKELTFYQNKTGAKYKSKLSKKKKDSKRAAKLREARRKVMRRIENKKKDILHKYSRTIVDYAVDKNIGNVVVGDCADIHNGINHGKRNNQQTQQNPEQKLKWYIKEKFESVTGRFEIIPEDYTTKTCPVCKTLNKPKNREYVCKNCGFVYDRDGVGSINIYNKVSFVENISDERIRLLTGPLFVRFKPNKKMLYVQHQVVA